MKRLVDFSVRAGTFTPVEAQRLTSRLQLKPISRADAGQLWHLHQDPGIARWYGGVWSTSQARAFAMDMEHAWQADGAGKWLAYRRDDAELVGRGGCSVAMVEGRRQVEIGWALREACWGQGYATEIGREGLALAFDTLHVERVVAFTEVHNLRSRAVMERIGMTYSHEFTSLGLISGSDDIHEDAVFALYEITRNQPS